MLGVAFEDHLHLTVPSRVDDQLGQLGLGERMKMDLRLLEDHSGEVVLENWTGG